MNVLTLAELDDFFKTVKAQVVCKEDTGRGAATRLTHLVLVAIAQGKVEDPQRMAEYTLNAVHILTECDKHVTPNPNGNVSKR